MQAILAFFQTAGTTAAAAAPEAAAATASTAATAATTAAAATTTAASGASWASTLLQGLRVGTSVVSALSVAGQADLQATALRQQAQDQNLQGRQEFIQGQEAANDLGRQYNALVQQQLSVASADGIDAGSGSVQDARAQAQADADRELSISRTGIVMNAALRRSRASYLTDAADLTQETGLLSAAGKAASSAGQIRMTG